MTTHYIDDIRENGCPLAELLASGPGFRIGPAGRQFALTAASAGEWTYRDDAGSLEVCTRLRPAGADAFIISTRLRNLGAGPVGGIDRLEPLHLVLAGPLDCWRHIFANGGTAEGHYPPNAYRTEDWSHLSQPLRIESHAAGRSSNLHLPLLVSLASRAPDADGLFCGMEWSGAWYISFEALDEGQCALSAGVKIANIELSPGEQIDLPAVHLGFFRGGPAAGTNALRRHLNEQVCPRYQGKPMWPRVSYDHWFGIGNGLSESLLRRQAQRAAELGNEVFVVDAAWFAGDFPYGVGNWRVLDEKKFPNGLEPLADYVRELGMDFGLWFEVERAGEDTQILREHPDWFVPAPRPGWETSYHLNLAIPEAQAHVIELVGEWIERLDIRWSRWDYNIEPLLFWEQVDPSLKIQFEYFKGLYHVLDTLMARYPNWMVESCASGGRRIDLGTMRRAHTYWFSDHSHEAPICRAMQARANRFLPGHLLNSSVAVGRDAGDAGFDDTAAISRMLGKLAFDGDIASWSPALTARMAGWVGEFKAIRHLLVQDFYQLLPQPATVEDWDAVQFVSYGGDESVVMAFSGNEGGACTLRLHGLDPAVTYRVTQVSDESEVVLSGAELMDAGLPVRLPAEAGGVWKIRV